MPSFAPNSPEFESRRRGVIARVIEAGMPGDLRGAVHYLCALLVDGTRPDEADRVLGIVLDAQGDAPDPFFRAAGNFKWDLNDTFLKDYNAGPFISMEFAMIARGHLEGLRPATRDRFEAALRRLLNGCRTRQADVAYTNISIITAAGWLGLASYFDDAAEVTAATRAFRYWLAFTRRHGITEFNSPNYAVVNLWGLVALRTFAEAPALINEIDDTLEWFMQDYLLHHHAACEVIAGANSRSYSYETGLGIGPIASLYYGDGPWREPSSMRFAGFPEAPVRAVFDRLRPLLTPPSVPYTVTTRNGSVDTTTYIAPAFSLGTMCGPFTHTQKISVLASYAAEHPRRSLYAHLSNRALAHNVHGYQRENRAIVLAGLEYLDREKGTSDLHFLTDFGNLEVLGVWIDGRPWDGAPHILARGQTVVARAGSAMVGIRLLATRPFRIDDPVVTIDRPTLLSASETGALLLRQYLIKSHQPVRLAQEGLTTGYVIELRNASGSPEAFSRDLLALVIRDNVYIDDDGLLRREVFMREGTDDWRFDVPVWDPNLRLFVQNEPQRIERDFNNVAYVPKFLLGSDYHKIWREYR